MNGRLRVFLWLLTAAFFGAFVGWFKGAGEPGSISGVRVALGDMSAPWLLLAFLVGSQVRSPRLGALLGLAATQLALVGFYVARSFYVDVAGEGFLGNLSHQIVANRIWFVVAVVSGPVFGALGAWGSRSGRQTAVFIFGGLMILEPLLWAGLTGGSSPPMERLVVWSGELVLGGILLAWGWRQMRQPGSRVTPV